MEIAVLNYSAKVSDADAGWMVRACNTQMIKHLAPLYGREPWTMTLYSDLSDLPVNSCYPMIIMDTPDISGALGYHTDDIGFIYSRIFVNPVLDNGGGILTGDVTVSSVLSHEACEMFADPDTTLWAKGTPIKQGDQYAYEICDPVQGDAYTISVGAFWGKRDVQVSNFVTPDWFKLNPIIKSTQYDYLNKVSSPFTMSPGGYMVVRNSQGTEQNVFGEILPPAWRMETKKHNMARTARRGVK